VPLEFSVTDDLTAAAAMSAEVIVEMQDAASPTGWTAVDTLSIVLPTTGSYAGTYTVGQDGFYRANVSVTDEGSNTTIVSSGFSVDTTPPSVVIVSPADGSTVNESCPPLAVESNEQSEYNSRVYLFSGVYRAYDESDYLDIPIDGCLQQQGGVPLLDGTYTVAVELTDKVNLTGSSYSTFSINAVGPFVEVLNPQDGDVITNGKINLKYNARDADQVEIWVKSDMDPNPVAPELVRQISPIQPVSRTYEETLVFPIDNNYTVTIVAIDRNSSYPIAVDTVSVIVDGQKPQVSITAPGDTSKYFGVSEVVTLQYQTSNATSVKVTLDGQVVEERTLSGTSTNDSLDLGSFAADGTHVVEVVVTDGRNQSAAATSFIVDSTPPVVKILSPANGAVYTNTSVSLLFDVVEANEVGSTKVWLDAVEQIGIASGGALEGLAVGDHTVEIESTDLAGNASARAIHTFTIEAEVVEEKGKRKGVSCKFEAADAKAFKRCTSSGSSAHNR